MRAVFLLQTDPCVPKPALRALREADALVRKGWQVSFISWIKGERPSEERGPYPVRRIQLPVPPPGASVVRRGLAYRRATEALAAAATDERPDLLVAHDLEVLRAGVRTGRGTGAPVVYDSHEDWPALIAEHSRWEARVARIEEGRLCRRVAHVVTVSDPIAEKFQRIGKPTTILYNARPSEDIHVADREESRRGLGYRDDDFVAGFAGALGDGRGLGTLLEAMDRLPARYKVRIVGGPEEAAEALRQQALLSHLEDRVRVDAYRPFRELAPYYAAMDIGVILLDPRPNHLRALPNKLFDYMAHGVPVLVPDYPAMGRLVREADCGIALSSVETGPLVDALRQASAEESKRRSLGGRGREAFLHRYAWEHQAGKFLSVVADVTGGS